MGDVIQKKLAGGETEERDIRTFSSIYKFPKRGKIGLTRVVPRNPPHQIMSLIEEWLDTKDVNNDNVISLKHFFEKCKKGWFLTRVSNFVRGRKTCPGELGQGKSRLGHFEQSYNASNRREDEFYKEGEDVILPYGISSYKSGDIWNKKFDGIYLDGRNNIVDAVGRPHIIATWIKAAPYEGEGGFSERWDQRDEHNGLMKEFLTKIAQINGPPPDENKRPRDGKHRFEYPNGDIYEGEWNDGKMDGSGTYTFNNTDTHTEVFYPNTNSYQNKNDTRGDVYDGQFKADKPDGLGTYKFVDGRVEISLYEDGLPKGNGVRWSRDRTKAAMVIDGKFYVKVGQRNNKNWFQEYEKEPHEARELAMRKFEGNGLTEEKLDEIISNPLKVFSIAK